MAFDVEAVRAQFPILSRQVNGKPLVYLDSAASAQKPRAVIDAMTAVMEGSYSNVHRGLHTLANETTDAYEAARKSVAGLSTPASTRSSSPRAAPRRSTWWRRASARAWSRATRSC